MKTNKTIKVCPECGTPLLWTFCFAYREYYCLNCGYGAGMMGAGNDVPFTKELQLKKEIVEAIWKKLYGKGRLLPPGQYGKDKCKGCIGSGDHNSHLSKREKEWNDVAWKLLGEIQGMFK